MKKKKPTKKSAVASIKRGIAQSKSGRVTPKQRKPAVEKARLIAPEQRFAQVEISEAGFIAAMRRLKQNEDFALLRSFWVNVRYQLLEQGKKAPKAEYWDELRGFDKAVMVSDQWAAKQTGDDLLSQRAEELAEDMV